jgi:hypothetical protein
MEMNVVFQLTFILCSLLTDMHMMRVSGNPHVCGCGRRAGDILLMTHTPTQTQLTVLNAFAKQHHGNKM